MRAGQNGIANSSTGWSRRKFSLARTSARASESQTDSLLSVNPGSGATGTCLVPVTRSRESDQGYRGGLTLTFTVAVLLAALVSPSAVTVAVQTMLPVFAIRL